MRGTRLPKILFFAILLAALAESTREFARLPDRMATHFAASGAPNGWMAKPQFFVLSVAMAALAAAVGFLAPRLIADVSPSRLNLPNKEFWLAPERRIETLAFFERHFAWFGSALLLLDVSVMQFVIEGNLRMTPQLSTGPFMLLISAFVIFTFAWSIAMLRRFSNPRRKS